jgi:hypothetical protein
MTVLSTAEREKLNAAWDAASWEGGQIRFGTSLRTTFEIGFLAARNFYGPERVAELERELDLARGAARAMDDCRASWMRRYEEAEQREHVLREALEPTVDEAVALLNELANDLKRFYAPEKGYPPHIDAVGHVCADLLNALAVSPEQPVERPVYEIERDRHGLMFSGPLDIGECMRVMPVDPGVSSEPPARQHCTVEGDILGTGDDNSAPSSSPEQPKGDGHRVVIEFDDGGVGAKLICPENGCEQGSTCGFCGHEYGSAETKPCYDCRDLKGPTECWIKSWFDNVGADELLHGHVEVPIRAEWDCDHMVAHIEQGVAPEQPEGSEVSRENRDELEAQIVRVIAGKAQDAIAGDRQSAKAGNAFRIARALITAFPVLGSSDREDPNG